MINPAGPYSRRCPEWVRLPNAWIYFVQLMSLTEYSKLTVQIIWRHDLVPQSAWSCMNCPTLRWVPRSQEVPRPIMVHLKIWIFFWIVHWSSKWFPFVSASTGAISTTFKRILPSGATRLIVLCSVYIVHTERYLPVAMVRVNEPPANQ